MTEYWNSLSAWHKFKFVFSIIIGILGVIFATLNWKEQEVHLLFRRATVPLSLVIIFSIAVGYAWSFIFDFQRFRKKEKEIDVLVRNINDLKKQLKDCIEVKKDLER